MSITSNNQSQTIKEETEQSPPYLNFPEQLLKDHINNLIQNFYVIGLDPKEIYTHPIRNSEIYPPKVLSKYPPVDLSYLLLDDSLISSHAFPFGIEIKDSLVDIEKKTDFIFSLQNPNPKKKEDHSDYEKIYFSCILFYEKLSDYSSINSGKIESFSLTFSLSFKNNNRNSKKNYDLYIPKIICFSSFVPLYNDLITLLNEVYYYSLNPYVPSNFIDNDFMYKKFSNGIVNIMDSATNNPRASTSTTNINLNSNVNFIPLEKIIHELVFNLPLPPRGLLQIQFNFYGKSTILISRSKANELPNPQTNLLKIIQIFKEIEIFTIIKCILLELPIIFFCSSPNLLTNIIEGFVSLIYPFNYPYPVISMFPNENYKLINNMKCFIIGINKDFSDDLYGKLASEIEEKNIVFVKIPRETFDIVSISVYKFNINNNQKGKFDYFDERFNMSLPDHYMRKTIKIIKEWIEKNKIGKYDYNSNLNMEIRNHFFYFFSKFIKKYQTYFEKSENLNSDDYVLYIKNNLRSSKLFNKNKFIDEDSSKEQFYNIFFEGKIFYDFLCKKAFPKTLEEKIDVLFYDEKVIEQLNKNRNEQTYKTPFLEDKMRYDYIMEVYPKFKICKFNNNEVEYIKQNKENLYDYYQYVTYTILSSEEEKKCQQYKIFPLLLYDGKFFKTLYGTMNNILISSINDSILLYTNNSYNLSNSILEYNKKNQQIIENTEDSNIAYKNYNYKLNILNDFSYPLKEYVNNLWIRLISYTFWNSSEIDINNKINKIISIYDEYNFIDSNTKKILFYNAVKYASIENVFKLFLLFQNINYNPYIDMISIKNKIAINNQSQNTKNNKICLEEDDVKLPNNFYFNTKILCKLCKKSFNLLHYLNTNRDYKRSIERSKYFTIKCPNCEKNIEIMNMKLKVINKNSGSKYKININLISPFYLLDNISIISNYKFDRRMSLFFKSENYLHYFWSFIFFFSHFQLDISSFIPNFDFCDKYIITHINKNFIDKNHYYFKGVNDISKLIFDNTKESVLNIYNKEHNGEEKEEGGNYANVKKYPDNIFGETKIKLFPNNIFYNENTPTSVSIRSSCIFTGEYNSYSNYIKCEEEKFNFDYKNEIDFSRMKYE